MANAAPALTIAARVLRNRLEEHSIIAVTLADSFLHVARSARHDPRERHADVGGPFTALAAERVLRDAHLVKPSIQKANKQTNKQTNKRTGGNYEPFKKTLRGTSAAGAVKRGEEPQGGSSPGAAPGRGGLASYLVLLEHLHRQAALAGAGPTEPADHLRSNGARTIEAYASVYDI